MSKIFYPKFKSDKEVNPTELHRLWISINDTLIKLEYTNDKLRMPNIQAPILEIKEYIRFARDFENHSETYKRISIEEYGDYEPMENLASFIFQDVHGNWKLILCKERALGDLQHYLVHEILHIWDEILGMSRGSLEKNLEERGIDLRKL